LRGITVFVLLAAALVQGTGLYANDPTFGDTLLLDYAGIFLWPFASDVVGRGLGNLKWPRALTVTLVPSTAVTNVGESVEFRVEVVGGPSGSAAWSCASSDASTASVVNAAEGCRATGVAPGSATVVAVVTKGTAKSTATADLRVL
jgi:hypothetical protein